MLWKDKKIKLEKKLLFIPLIGVISYPAILSFDIFNYLATARVAFHYFENPYIVMPIEFTGDSMLLFTRAANKIALYGPSWIVLTAFPYLLSFGNYLLSLVLIKLLVSAFYFGTTWLIWKISKSRESVIFFAANPLIICETFISGHNDIVMMFPVLFSFYLLKNNKLILPVVFYIASVLVKFSTIVLLPLLIFILIKNIRREDIDYQKVYGYSALLMLAVFMISPIREELYPWYAVWFITFVALLKNRFIKEVVAVFSFGLMLRYIPFMLTGNYFGSTPLFRNILMVTPPLIFHLFTWARRYFR
jgi:hypothetical protein